MLIEQHVQSFAFADSEHDVIMVGAELLKQRGISTAKVTMTGKEPGVNHYGEPIRIMYADVIEIRAAPVNMDWTYNIYS